MISTVSRRTAAATAAAKEWEEAHCPPPAEVRNLTSDPEAVAAAQESIQRLKSRSPRRYGKPWVVARR
jgi:hypothetical protein